MRCSVSSSKKPTWCGPAISRRSQAGDLESRAVAALHARRSAAQGSLQSGADSLTLADANEEGANLLALLTRQQLSTTALSLASQASQSVLRLFQ